MGIFGKVGEILSSNSNLKKELEELKEKVNTQDKLLQEGTSDAFASSQARESKYLVDVQGTVRRRVPVRDLQKLYLNNQFTFRAINVRADELVCRGYDIVGDDEVGVKACKDLIERSGGVNLFWQLSVNTDVCGDGYQEKVKSPDGKAISYLRHINPVGFGFLTVASDDLTIILGSDKTPKSYMQVYYDENSVEQRKEIPKERVLHLKFNTFADEFNGISSIQPVYNTAIRLMNMEHAAAEAAVKTANPMFIGNTTAKSPMELAKWSSVLSKLSSKEEVFLPNGMTLSVISPGKQNFNEYAGYFLDAVVAASGVPKAILTGTNDSSSGNRGSVSIQSFPRICRTCRIYCPSFEI